MKNSFLLNKRGFLALSLCLLFTFDLQAQNNESADTQNKSEVAKPSLQASKLKVQSVDFPKAEVQHADIYTDTLSGEFRLHRVVKLKLVMKRNDGADDTCYPSPLTCYPKYDIYNFILEKRASLDLFSDAGSQEFSKKAARHIKMLSRYLYQSEARLIIPAYVPEELQITSTMPRVYQSGDTVVHNVPSMIKSTKIRYMDHDNNLQMMSLNNFYSLIKELVDLEDKIANEREPTIKLTGLVTFILGESSVDKYNQLIRQMPRVIQTPDVIVESEKEL